MGPPSQKCGSYLGQCSFANARKAWDREESVCVRGVAELYYIVLISTRAEKMFPSHLSVNDLGVFAVVMVFGLIIVLLFMFDFVSIISEMFCTMRSRGLKSLLS